MKWNFCVFAAFILSLFLNACSKNADEISTAVPAGYGVASKIELGDWQNKAMAALAIAEANAAEPSPAEVAKHSKPAFGVHVKKAKFHGHKREKNRRSVALARRK